MSTEHGQGGGHGDAELHRHDPAGLVDLGDLADPVVEHRVEVVGRAIGLRGQEQVERDPGEHQRVGVVVEIERTRLRAVQGERPYSSRSTAQREREHGPRTEFGSRLSECRPGVVMLEVADLDRPSGTVGRPRGAFPEIGLERLVRSAVDGRADGLELVALGAQRHPDPRSVEQSRRAVTKAFRERPTGR